MLVLSGGIAVNDIDLPNGRMVFGSPAPYSHGFLLQTIRTFYGHTKLANLLHVKALLLLLLLENVSISLAKIEPRYRQEIHPLVICANN